MGFRRVVARRPRIGAMVQAGHHLWTRGRERRRKLWRRPYRRIRNNKVVPNETVWNFFFLEVNKAGEVSE